MTIDFTDMGGNADYYEVSDQLLGVAPGSSISNVSQNCVADADFDSSTSSWPAIFIFRTGSFLSASCSITYTLTVPANQSFYGTYDWTVDLFGWRSDPYERTVDTISSPVPFEVVESPSIAVTVSADPTEFAPSGTSIERTVKVENTGGSEISLTSLTSDLIGDVTTADSSTCSLPQTISVGASYQCSYSRSESGTSTIEEEITASGNNPGNFPVEDSDVVTLTVQETDLSVSLVANPTEAIPGDTVEFIATVSNDGEVDAANVVVDIPTPAGYTVTAVSTDKPSGASDSIVSGDAQATIDEMAPDEVVTVTVTATIDNDAGGPITATVEVTSDNEDRNINNNTDSATVTVLGAVDAATGLIGAMQELRAKLILQHGPDAQRRLNRLKGIYSNNGGVSGFGLAYRNETLPFAVTLGRDNAAFAYSLRNSRAEAAKQGMSGTVGSVATSLLGAPEDYRSASANGSNPGGTQALAYSGALSASEKRELGVDADVAPLAMFGEDDDTAAADPMDQRYDIWAEGQYSKFDATAGDGTFAILHAGADYLVTKDLLVGLGTQFDWIDMDAASGPGTADGWGFMVGPYMTAKLTDGLYLDARGAWGQSYNHVSPFGTYEDPFDGTRWLATAALIGDFEAGDFSISPTARLSWFRERSEAYVDSLLVPIPSVTTETGIFEFGPTISRKMVMEDGTVFMPFTTVTGIWTFEQTNTATALSSQPGLAEEGIRARVEAGFDVANDKGLSLSLSGHYDGIGDEGFESYGGRARIGQKF